MIALKRCPKCKITYGLECFWKDKYTKSGLKSRCKRCDYKKKREWELSHREIKNVYGREANKRYFKKHPERVKAKNMAKYHFKDNHAKCSHCGILTECHRHHPDYSKPKNIEFLCPPCHIKEHHPLSDIKEGGNE